MRRSLTNVGLFFACLILSIASFEVVVSAAGSEPFFAFSRSDAFHYVGFAAMLMFAWVQLAVAIVVGVACRRVSAWWCLGAVLSVAGVLGLCTAVDTWTSDMEAHVSTPSAPLSTHPK